MQLKVYILIFGCIFFYNASAQIVDKDTLKTVNILTKRDSILKMTVLNSNVPHYVISNAKLNQLSAIDVGDALKFIPGTYIKDYGGIGGLKTVSYRSLSASHTTVELDGLILPSTQTAVVNLSGFDIFSIQQLEMTAGQVQDNYSYASAYVKSNLLSIKSTLNNFPKYKYNVKLMGLISTINSYQNGLFYQQKLNQKWAIGVQALSTYGSGIYPFTIKNVDSTYTANRKNSDIKNYQITGAAVYKHNYLKMYLNGSYSNNYQHLPGAVILYNPFNNQTLSKTLSKSAFNLQYAKHKYAFGFHLFGQHSYTIYRDFQFLNQQGYLENFYDNKAFGTGYIVSRFLGTKTQKLFFGTDLILTNLNGNQFTITPKRTQINSVIGISKWLWRFKFQGNISHQFINDYTPNENKNISHFSPFTSMSIIPFKKLNFRLRTHYKNTYRLPSFNDLYYNSIGNKNLKAENAQSFNFGLTYGKKFKNSIIETTIDLYKNEVTNQIVAIPTKNLFNWSMQNIGHVSSRGIDFNLLFTTKFNKHEVTFSTGHTFNTSIDITDPSTITYGHQIPYTPKYSSNYTLTYGFDKTYFTCTVLQSSSRYILNENSPYNLLDGFIDFSLSLSKSFVIKNHRIYGKLQGVNLLNNNYEMIKSFPMPGRHYRVKLIYQFKT